MIYFDNAATTPMSKVAIEALISVSKDNFGNASAIYSYGKKSRKILDESRKIIANCIGAEPEEIFFTSGGTESDNWAVEQVVSQSIEHIITSQVEHHAILNPINRLEAKGIKVTHLPVNDGCIIDTEALFGELDGSKKFVSLMYQNNETGVIQPIKEAARLVHDNNPNSIFHTDAVQAIGHSRIDVKDLGIDMLSASAHKFNGPKGIGFLYVRKGLNVCSMIDGGGQEFGLRSGTENIAGIYSMARALEENVQMLEKNISKLRSLEARLLCNLDEKSISYHINGDATCKCDGIINISFAGVDGEALLNTLDTQDIFVSTGSACNSESKERSHVLKAMNIDNEVIDEAIRISIGRYNTEMEIDGIARCIYRYIELVNRIGM